jgi:hypothetical protein
LWIESNEQLSVGATIRALPVRMPANAHKENFMRKSRYQKGSVKKQRGRWIAMWWEGPNRKSRAGGLVKDMPKSDGIGDA